MISTHTNWQRILPFAMALLLAMAVPVAESGGGHDQGAIGHNDHDHGDEDEHSATLVVTHFTDLSELFLEYSALVAGESSRFLAHITDLRDFSAVRTGTLVVTLSQGGTVKAGFRVRTPSREGLFTPEVTPRDAGNYDLALTLDAPGLKVTHHLGRVTVYASKDEVPELPEDESGEVSYLKEQQWRGGFALTEVQEQTLMASVPAPAILQAPADRFVTLRAPAEGVLTAPQGGLPSIGDQVRRGQVLATLRPRLAGGTDTATLRLAVKRAEADERLARQNLDRLEDLLKAGAVAAHRVNEARSALQVATAERTTAQSRVKQLNRTDSGAGVPLLATIDGRIADLRVVPGALIGADEVVMQIVGDGPLWLRAEVAEADASRIDTPPGAWFDLGNRREVLRAGENARLVGVSGIIDPVSRTLPVIFEFTPNGQANRIRLNQRVQAEVLTGEQLRALAVPRGALIDDGGQPVVYVQTGGESFTRRAVRLGLRDQDRVAVLSGVAAGERVVSQGAYDVHLSAAGPAEVGHGHAH